MGLEIALGNQGLAGLVADGVQIDAADPSDRIRSYHSVRPGLIVGNIPV
jgi:hypothetical protein